MKLDRILSIFGPALCAAALLVLQPATANAQTELTKVRIGLLPIDDVAPVHVGIKKGFFAAEGLQVEVVPSTGGAVGIPALVSGALDITYGNTVSTILAAQQGLDMRFISMTLRGAPDLSGLIVRKSDGIKTGADLAGKTVAVNARNGVVWLYTRAWIAQSGGDPSKVNFREIPFPQMPDALAQKQVDAVFVVDPFRSALNRNPEYEQIALPYKAVQPTLQVGTYIVSASYLAKNKAVVDKFLKALQRSNDWYDANLRSPERIEISAGYTGAKPELIRSLADRPSLRGINESDLEKTMQQMKQQGLLKKDVEIQKMIYNGTL